MTTSYPFDQISIPYRAPKPRKHGLTMVLDKGLTLNELKGFVETAGHYVDVIKFGWATSRLIEKSILEQKVECLLDNNINSCLGGSFTELAFMKGQVSYLMDSAKDMGFNCYEISDGIIDISQNDKLNLIEAAKQRDFIVFSEQGKKDEVKDRRLTLEQRVSNSKTELAAGAWKVIVEARENGCTGIFDDNGDVIPSTVEGLLQQIDISNFLFEAPIVSQQEWLVHNFGTNINLGNIKPEDVITLESIRCGLRANTMTQFHIDGNSIRLRLGPSGAYEAAMEGDNIIIVDALRASSTIVTALSEGVTSVKPVLSISDCVGELTAGERGGKKSSNLMLDNSPVEFLNRRWEGKELVLTTTNGTECIHSAASGEGCVLIGSMLNLTAIAEYVEKNLKMDKRNISIIIAGRNNAIAGEDLHVASEIAFLIKGTVIKGYINPEYFGDSLQCFLNSDSGVNLIAQGRIKDVEFCAQKNLFNVVPLYDKPTKTICLV